MLHSSTPLLSCPSLPSLLHLTLQLSLHLPFISVLTGHTVFRHCLLSSSCLDHPQSSTFILQGKCLAKVSDDLFLAQAYSHPPGCVSHLQHSQCRLFSISCVGTGAWDFISSYFSNGTFHKVFGGHSSPGHCPRSPSLPPPAPYLWVISSTNTNSTTGIIRTTCIS